MSNESGELYVVATPIGNLGDISERAREVLKHADLIAAEDTRHSKKLLSHLSISTPMQSYHEHNERSSAAKFLRYLEEGKSIALISDAGTPLLNDPGFQLLKLAHEHHIKVIPVPGPSALVSALSVAGLSADRFVFDGFLPEKQQARIKRLQSLTSESRTIVFYETPHRIKACLNDCLQVFGAERQVCIAREISKYYETIRKDSLPALLGWIEADQQQLKGEFVLVIEGADGHALNESDEGVRVLKILLQSLSVSEAAAMAAEITGIKKNELYKTALGLSN
ncbi:MAG: 16S rRNA (cytidine(1402)-2'-O)-methyltransferase [Gammaproteobacteria bacterium]|nr:16S rRNA (cytidine(1402)-2'-O)-methyltransferase [Gammaproteobacteria bacterium]